MMVFLHSSQPNGSTTFPSDFPYHPFHGFDGGERFRGAANSAVEALLHSQVSHPASALHPSATAATAPSASTTSCSAVDYDLAINNSLQPSIFSPVKIEKSPLLTAWRTQQEQQQQHANAPHHSLSASSTSLSTRLLRDRDPSNGRYQPCRKVQDASI